MYRGKTQVLFFLKLEKTRACMLRVTCKFLRCTCNVKWSESALNRWGWKPTESSSEWELQQKGGKHPHTCEKRWCLLQGAYNNVIHTSRVLSWIFLNRCLNRSGPEVAVNVSLKISTKISRFRYIYLKKYVHVSTSSVEISYMKKQTEVVCGFLKILSVFDCCTMLTVFEGLERPYVDSKEPLSARTVCDLASVAVGLFSRVIGGISKNSSIQYLKWFRVPLRASRQQGRCWSQWIFLSHVRDQGLWGPALWLSVCEGQP